MKQSLRAIIPVLLALAPATGAAVTFCDHGPSRRFMETGIQFMVGGSTVTQNYKSCFQEIRQISSSMSTGWGFGMSAEFGIREYLALGTQINLLINNNSIDFAVSNDNATSVSNIFLNNRFYYLNFPVYVSFRFNLAPTVRWNIDGGFYYSYGIGGSQKQTVYNSTVNSLGQLINRVTVSKPGYFEDENTFINRYLRGDLGLYLASGLTIRSHYMIGVRSMMGFKNTSTVGENGLINPRIHNLNLMMVLGYKF